MITNESVKFKTEEMETYITRAYGEQEWTIFTNNPRDIEKFKKKNFPIVKERLYSDGTVEYAEFKVPLSAVTFKNQVLSDKEKARRKKLKGYSFKPGQNSQGGDAS